MFWQFIYNTLVMPTMFIGFQSARCCNPKIQEGVKGRKDVFTELTHQLRTARPLEKTVWFHFTSVGEFEQAKPLIEAVYADTRIVLTFFSPSVAPNARSYPYADAAVYLPLDTPRNAKRLIRFIEPTLIVFSKFDIWPNLVWKAAKYDIPIIVVAGPYTPNRKGSPALRSRFFGVSTDISECIVRFQRQTRRVFKSSAHQRIRSSSPVTPAMNRSTDGQLRLNLTLIFSPAQETLIRPILIAGSTYAEDERVLLPAYQLLRQNIPDSFPHLILVPHEPTPERIKEICSHLDRAKLAYRCFSELTPEIDLSAVDVLIVDTVGLLAKLYGLADIAFVGGSFRGSVHNVMEPAAMATPVIFGPTIQNAHEASLIVDRGGAQLVHDSQQLARVIKGWLEDDTARTTAGSIGKQLIEENLGAVERTLAHLRKYV